MKTCKEMLLDEDKSYEDRKELHTDLATIERYSSWLFSCAETAEETKVLFDTVLNLISAQRLKRDAEIKEQREKDIAGMVEFEKIIEQHEEAIISTYKDLATVSSTPVLAER